MQDVTVLTVVDFYHLYPISIGFFFAIFFKVNLVMLMYANLLNLI